MSSTDHIWFQTRLQQKLREHKQKTFTGPSENPEEKKKDTETKKRALKNFLRYKQAQ